MDQIFAFLIGFFASAWDERAHVPRGLRWLSRGLSCLLAAVAAILLVLCCMAAWDYLQAGERGTALALGVTALLMLAAVYLLFLRGVLRWIRRKRRQREN
ncbi:MAG TPA: hypothetical protein IAC15_01935 [Candidatus Onthomonas avicola]|nr:hypothetical protein [Candidatus Onthomonas avicola]